MEPGFEVTSILLLNRGFSYAVAHVRGGGELGKNWHKTGSLLEKKNSFTDFIDCAEYLIAEKFTSKGHLHAMGGSGGSILMGAIINLRPDLWNGVSVLVPVVGISI